VVKNALAANILMRKTVGVETIDPGLFECNFISGSKKIIQCLLPMAIGVSSDWEITKAEVPAAAND